jgi:hypothetical protein
LLPLGTWIAIEVAFNISTDDERAFRKNKNTRKPLNKSASPKMMGIKTEIITKGATVTKRNLLLLSFSVVNTNPPHGLMPK